ncbi:MAG TPA: pyridoxamine 5'-phosphate oxidase family protein [Polyangiaceae bacterium]|nr:pyridoxamine 5'-phosphate oxidase family protein [Polyangiaceae bacterium]
MSLEASGSGSSFHAGEVALQREAGVAERMARIGAQVIRDHMPEQHRLFFPLLPFLVVGSVDGRGQPTASLLSGAPGFVSSPDATTLRIDARPLPGDPLAEQLRAGAPLGVLGIQQHTARRNRANGTVLATDAGGFSLGVRQSFGNCPKYIVRREATFVGSSTATEPRVSTPLGARERAIIAGADTFFLASAHPEASRGAERAHGVDVSHRGGPPGFAAFIDDETFVIPDFPGNNFYNTLGNLRLNTAAGLLFIDVASGDVLQLEARAEVATGTHPLAGPEFEARVVRFRVQRARLFPRASGLRFREPE